MKQDEKKKFAYTKEQGNLRYQTSPPVLPILSHFDQYVLFLLHRRMSGHFVQTREKTALNTNRAKRISLTHDLDLYLWPLPSIPWELWSWPTHTQTFGVNGQSIPKIEWKQTNGHVKQSNLFACNFAKSVSILKTLSPANRMITILQWSKAITP